VYGMNTATYLACDTASGGYRYGYGSHEKIDEVYGSDNVVDMGDRWLDVRLGRTPKPDAKGYLYPSVSPYSYANNNPILFIDPDGKVIVVANKDAQAQTLSILTKAFGEKASGFGFNEKNELTFTGNPNEFKGREGEVFGGLQTVMRSETVTNIVYEKNANTDKHGGEATATISDNPNLKENTITIDPVEVFETKIGENYQTEYKGKNGGTTTNIYMAETDAYGNPIKTGTYKKTDIIAKDSKAARFFHGIGHVLFQKNSEQEQVIQYENKARSIFKQQKNNGKFKSAPESERPIDDSHTNKPD
ncbi:MAG: hypothetical protein ACR2MS_02515, partial [Weeksellaceae bacterium]